MLRTLPDVKKSLHLLFKQCRTLPEYRTYVGCTGQNFGPLIWFSEFPLADCGVSDCRQSDGVDETAVHGLSPAARRPWKPGKQ